MSTVDAKGSTRAARGAARAGAAQAGGDARGAMRREVLAGLTANPKRLSPKFFYDREGAALFEAITRLPEYYPTRTEIGILRARAAEIAALAGPGVGLIEYGSGAGVKVRTLLDALEEPVAYVPIDIAADQLEATASAIRRDYPGLGVHPVRADYTRPLDLPKLPGESRHVAFFPGSTIGNFEPAAAAEFLGRIRRTVGTDGALVLGVDRVKDAAILERAYDDADGVTARFNLNLLVRLNRELGADFDLAQFRHRACWNAEASRIEMHLVSQADQVVTIGDARVAFARGETIWTESSYKYDAGMLAALVDTAGFRIARLWTDARDWFWVAYLE